MLPLLLAGAVWGYNAIRAVQLRNGNNRIRKRNSEDEETKNLSVYKDCIFRHEDKRTFNFNHYDRCTINNYFITIKKGDDDESG